MVRHYQQSPPVVFLVYANDRIDPEHYLRNLKQEIDVIRDALRPAEDGGLCEVVFEPNASAEQVFRVFCSPRYRNRIAVFHYAGHADDHRLLFEDATGGHGAAGAAGLAEFLGLQSALQLVFLNGCSTEGQVEDLVHARCRVVISTSQQIKDDIAVRFAQRFYQGLASDGKGGQGIGLRQAFDEAVARTKVESSDGSPRGLYWGGIEWSALSAGHWPWMLRLDPADEGTALWNLARAASDPLFGLPPLPELDLPDRPFPGLNWFQRTDAAVFFGRGAEIRRLYDALTDDGAPIILFYGQSGVGKSSILDAGLLPRLEGSHNVRYLRRDKARGLLGTLLSAFGESDGDLATIWHAAERGENAKPMLIVLDQVEEVYALPNDTQPNEFEDLADALQRLFADRGARPPGRLILSFRKEWQPEIAQRLQERGLLWEQVFVEPMTRTGIIEAITGPVSTARLRRHYRLEIGDETAPEARLATEIADDLLADRGSPVAPTLQILLTKLWEQVADQDRRRFTRAQYLDLKTAGNLLGNFLDQQIDGLAETLPAAANSGLALDVLAHHTTPNGFAAQRTVDELADRYRSHGERLSDLIAECKRRSLLADLPAPPDQPPRRGSRLAHDTLAPLIRERFDKSVRPGQVARRILENRAIDWSDGRTGPVLDEADLKLVEVGVAGMRDRSKDEERLVVMSRQESARRRVRRLWQVFAIPLIIAAGSFAAWQWQAAVRQGRVALARSAVQQAASLAADAPQRALLLAATVTIDSPPEVRPEAENVLRGLLSTTGGTILVLPQDGNGRQLPPAHPSFSPDGKWLAALAQDQSTQTGLSLYLWTMDDPVAAPRRLSADSDQAQDFVFDPKGRWVAVAAADGRPRLYPIDDPRGPAPTLVGASTALTKIAFDSEGLRIAGGGADGVVYLWDLRKADTAPVEAMRLNDPVAAVFFDPAGNWIAARAGYEKTEYRDFHGRGLPQVQAQANRRHCDALRHDGDAANAELEDSWGGYVTTSLNYGSCDPSGRWLAVSEHSVSDYFVHMATVYLIDLHNPAAEKVEISSTGWTDANRSVSVPLSFDPQGRWLAFIGGQGTVDLLDLKSRDRSVRTLPGAVLKDKSAVRFAPSGGGLIAWDASNVVRYWNRGQLESNAAPQVMIGHDRQVLEVAPDPRDRWLVTAGSDGMRTWRLGVTGVDPVVLDFPSESEWKMRAEIQGTSLYVTPGDYGVPFRLDLEHLPIPPTAAMLDKCIHLRRVGLEPLGGEYSIVECENNHLLVRQTETGRAFRLPLDGLGARDTQIEDRIDLDKSRNCVRLTPDYCVAPRAVEASRSPEGAQSQGGDAQPGDGVSSGEDRVNRWSFIANDEDLKLILEDSIEKKRIPLQTDLPEFSSWDTFVDLFSPDGRWLAVYGRNLDIPNNNTTSHEVVVWDMKRPQVPGRVLRGDRSSSQVKGLAFHPKKGAELAVASSDETVRIWSLDHPNLVPAVFRQPVPIEDVWFDYEGRWLVTEAVDWSLRVWNLADDRLRDLACRVAGRNLTQKEWTDHFGYRPYRATCTRFPGGQDEPDGTLLGALHELISSLFQ
jgi:WD40 repeat protein